MQRGRLAFWRVFVGRDGVGRGDEDDQGLSSRPGRIVASMRPSPRPSNWATFLLSVHSSISIVGKKAGCSKRTQTRIKTTNVVCKELHISIQGSKLIRVCVLL